MTISIYILECEQGKYYVGRSAYVRQRILSHFNKHGSEWTKLYKPKRIISTFVGDAFDEEKYTLKTMETFGVDNVRGGSYCAVILSNAEKAKAKQTIQSLSDKCYKCGSSGHFATDCKKNQKECSMCEGTKRLYLGEGDWGDCIMCESESDSESDDEKTDICWRCKKPDYDGDDCKWCLKHEDDCRCNDDTNWKRSSSKYCVCCIVCGETGRSYWSDGIYGACLECCCIDCSERNWNCKCDPNEIDTH